MSGRACKCKLLCTVNVTYEGWQQQQWRNNKNVCQYIHTQHFIFPAQSQKRLPSPLCAAHLRLQSCRHPEIGFTTICFCSDDGLRYLPRWSESAGISPRGVYRIQLPSITDKYRPVKRLFPFKWWHKNKSLYFRNWAKQGSSATFMFTESQWIHYLFGTISWLMKYFLSTMSNEVAQLFGDI